MAAFGLSSAFEMLGYDHAVHDHSKRVCMLSVRRSKRRCEESHGGHGPDEFEEVVEESTIMYWPILLA
jgi:hypothetical protein